LPFSSGEWKWWDEDLTQGEGKEWEGFNLKTQALGALLWPFPYDQELRDPETSHLESLFTNKAHPRS
jgi:hypothetical protein